ncbi:MAG: MotA/TolQ/ExbB proton channel family protein [Fibrobacteria bacterium]|nr:MotA/TolQ/ExbB proton channel family protein [Fibrobacteria bacterium]
MIETAAKFFNEGGTFMWIILGVGAFALAVIVERLFFYFLACRGDSRGLVARIARAIENDKPEEAEKLVAKKKSPVHKLLAVAVQRYKRGMPYEDIQQGVEETAIKELPRFSSRLSSLGMFANIATLTGLLGTIFGLQVSFSSLQLAEGAEKASALATGIAQAMNTTAMGLLVAIPCMIAFTQLSNKQTSLTEDVDEATVKVLNFLQKKMA